MSSPDLFQNGQHAEPGTSQEQKCDGQDAPAEKPESETESRLKPVTVCMFAAVFGDGKKPEGVSRPVFMSKAARAAISDLKNVGTFRRTSGGQLFYCLEGPKPRIVPLIADDIRLKTLINTKFNINAASRELFSHIVTAAQMECFENGLMAEVHQLSHFNRKVSYALYFRDCRAEFSVNLDSSGRR